MDKEAGQLVELLAVVVAVIVTVKNFQLSQEADQMVEMLSLQNFPCLFRTQVSDVPVFEWDRGW